MSKKHSYIESYFMRYCVVLSLFFVFGCSNTKYLPKGDLLYTGGTVTVKDTILNKKDRKALESELETLLRPKPNKQILGLKPKLWFYNIAGEPKKQKGIRYWLRNKVGEAPVLFSKVDLEYNASVLRNFAENRGYFKTRVSADSTVKDKRVTAEYIVIPKKQYKIKSVTFPQDSSEIAKVISKTSRRSLLKVGNPYDLDIIKAERERIDARLKEKGYYYFNPDYILAQVDSSKGDHEVKIKLKIKEETPVKATVAYKIDKILVYPNYSLSNDSAVYRNKDRKQYNDFTIIDTADTFKPRVFDRTIYFKKGDLYNRKDHNLTLNRFVNLGTFNFVKNEFKESDSIKNALDSYYYLTLLPKKFIRVEVLGKTNSASYTGTEINANWNNRNFFRGAELFTVSVFSGADFQLSGQNSGKNIYKLGAETSLTWPRFITPFRIEGNSEFVPRTKATLRYEYQKRTQLYALNSFNTSFGYLWKENIRKEHQFNIVDITYVSPNNVTPEYLEDIEEDASLGRVIEKQLIFGPTYSYTYTNTMQKRKKNTFYFNGELDLAGNITGLVTGANIKKNDTIKIFDVPFSQYVKIKADLRHYLKLGKESELASRIILGAGFAYGNSNTLPTSKQFVVGGTNSIRAFRARSLGPGSYKAEVTSSDYVPDQSADLKLEFNTEYRAKLFSIVRGAVFVDAGNIWLLNADPNRPNAEITKDFMKQIAVGAGAGLRFDLSFLVLRTDLAFPLRIPYLPEGQRWVIDDINFGSGSWRKDNLIFNIAIGYPF
ncbi:BamA/TamA family outer membrane protein [Flavobacterium sp. Fl-318]|uniref:BamA/TamA family outer membrane protein n=1 Tax=Flavobacterium cupriresistens TaxID=2893885 RepID=A0ABU4R860_9FLAO|nr:MULTISPECIES: BamA/TamA family outer membrane protein [unclassified Flavobacterium]MDX6188753.1 BamA/TamA family outer membrane protein [Flavobacterium sp. Fl-318]UFH44461.1 BamA/TamA family outer membrane protein [Flavobacterium sp. F-323]